MFRIFSRLNVYCNLTFNVNRLAFTPATRSDVVKNKAIVL